MKLCLKRYDLFYLYVLFYLFVFVFACVVGKYEIMFKRYDLDYCLLSISPPGMSRINSVERSMGGLSGFLLGVRLDIEQEGKHIRSGKVINEEVCKKNFDKAGKDLSNIFDGKNYGLYQITSKYVPLEEDKKFLDTFYNYEIDLKWAQTHARFGSFAVQFSKCLPGQDCPTGTCKEWRSELYYKLGANFIPYPILSKRDVAGSNSYSTFFYTNDEEMKTIHAESYMAKDGFRYSSLWVAMVQNKMYAKEWERELATREAILAKEREERKNDDNANNIVSNIELKRSSLCMDTYVPSVSTNEMICRICKDCGQYLQSKAMLRDHRRRCHPRRRRRH